MEQSSVVPSEGQKFSSFTNQLKSLRTRVVTAFNGTSVIEPRRGDATPRIGLQLLARSQDPNEQSRSGMSHAGRDHFSNGPLTEPRATPAETIRPMPAVHVAPSSSSSSEGRNRSRRPTRRNGRTAGRRRRQRQYPVAWVRPVNEPSKVSEVYRSCLGPGLKTKEVRRKILECVVAATLLSITLAIYLTLAFSDVVHAREFHILMILLLMMLTIYLCHSLIRLFMVSSCRFNNHRPHRRARTRVGLFGYAHPDQPIPIRLARDEEVAAGEDGHNGTNERPIPPPPPAYGTWRGSVVCQTLERINPNLVYWERADRSRNRCHGTNQNNGQASGTTHRPPSYVSDDGGQYVADIQPQRPTEPSVRDPGDDLIHPAERNQTKS